MAQGILNTPRETTHQRIAAALEAIEQNMSDEHEAVNIDYDNTYSGLSADNVQEAIDELVNEKADKSTTLAGYGITDAYTKTETDTLLDGKVDKITGKGLSTNDYTTADKNKLAGIEAQANKTVVDSAMSDSSTNPLQNKVITKELEGAKTTTGNPITVTDAAPVNAVNLSMDLEPVQDLHGYDHPWVGGAGKNKLPMTVEGIKSANTGGSWSGNVYSINNGTIEILVDSDNNITGFKANGTFNANTTFYLATSLPLSGEYIISTTTALPNGCYMSVRGGATADISPNYTDRSFTANGNCSVTIYIPQSANLTNYVYQPMIRLSTETDSSFAPYTNKASISGRSEVAIQRVGKNLIGLGTSLNGFAGNTTFTDSATTVGFYFETKKLPDIITINAINGNRAYYSYYNEIPANGVPFEEKDQTQQTLPRTITVNKNYKYIHIQFSYNETNVTNIQVEQGSTPTSYKPFAGKTYTIQFGETVYGAQLDVTNGNMVVDKGYATITTLGRNAERSYWATISNAKPGFNIICNKEKTAINSFAIGVFVNDSGSFRINTEASYSSASECINAYGGSLDICYELATPITIQLTPQQIKLLENTNTIYTDYDGDTITIEYQPNNAIGEAVRVVEESYDPEFAVRPVLKKKAFSGTTDTDGSVTLINASDIPSNHRIIPLQITDMTIGGSAGTYFVEYKPYNSGDSVKGYCYTYYNGSQTTPVGTVVTGNFYYYDLEG